MRLQDQIKKKSAKKFASKPIIFDLSRARDRRRLEKIFNSGTMLRVQDEYRAQIEEYFEISHPEFALRPDVKKIAARYVQQQAKKKPIWQQGRWVFFPWLSILVHILEEREFQQVRTARNRNLITKSEQEVFYRAVVGVAGLSVGNSIALAIVLQGGARHIRLADPDNLELSNLNRIRAGVEFLGLNKAEITARQIYTLNPYARVEIFPKGLNPFNLKKFVLGPPKLDIIIDEMDNLEMKYLTREQARKHRLPVLMAADNADSAVIDIERYDQNPRLPFFHRRLGRVTQKKLVGLSRMQTGKLITRQIGVGNISTRMQKSFLDIGKRIVSWPQLGSTAMLNGSAIAYVVGKILKKDRISSNRIILSLDKLSIPGYNSKKAIEARKQAALKFRKLLKL